MAMSGEAQDVAAAQLTTFTNMGSERTSLLVSFLCYYLTNVPNSFLDWKFEIEGLNNSQTILETMSLAMSQQQIEHNYRCLNLLQLILLTRRTLPEDQFLARFADRHDMEHILLLALIQGLTCNTQITRLYVWHYYDSSALDTPIPGYGSAYAFYDALDRAGASVPGFFLLPPLDSEGQAEWVTLLVSRLSFSFLFLLQFLTLP